MPYNVFIHLGQDSSVMTNNILYFNEISSKSTPSAQFNLI